MSQALVEKRSEAHDYNARVVAPIVEGFASWMRLQGRGMEGGSMVTALLEYLGSEGTTDETLVAAIAALIKARPTEDKVIETLILAVKAKRD